MKKFNTILMFIALTVFSTQMAFAAQIRGTVSNCSLCHGFDTGIVDIKLTGDTESTIQTETDGSYRFRRIGSGSYTVTPDVAGHDPIRGFDPESTSVTVNRRHVTGIDFSATCVAATECTEGFNCGTEDDGCGGTIDCGGDSCGAGESCVLNICELDCIPTTELCDGLDNDCDGSVDEDLTQATSCGVGACSSTGTETCSAGSWTGDTCSSGTPSAESCNDDSRHQHHYSSLVKEFQDYRYLQSTNRHYRFPFHLMNTHLLRSLSLGLNLRQHFRLDDDCDGSVDEDLTQATSCGVGACSSSGTETCSAGSWTGDTCSPGTPSLESCNDVDDDCDGSVDEDLTQATSCGVGACSSSGTETCSAGSWTGDTCSPGTPSLESCNDVDDDCDGSVDEDLTQATSCGEGECTGNTGLETCTAGSWEEDTCNPMEGAVTEICDGLDNNCDGSTDEGCDSDGDGVDDDADNCPNVCNGNQLDADEDGIGDVCDPDPGCGGCGNGLICETVCDPGTDTDTDGIPDFADNCIDIPNPDQEDEDNNGIGDACDTNTVFGTISGNIPAGVIVGIWSLDCGLTAPIAEITIDENGYYEYGALDTNGRYLLTVIPSGYSFVPRGYWLDIPQEPIQSYDFSFTAD